MTPTEVVAAALADHRDLSVPYPQTRPTTLAQIAVQALVDAGYVLTLDPERQLEGDPS